MGECRHAYVRLYIALHTHLLQDFAQGLRLNTGGSPCLQYGGAPNSSSSG
jgi:hypothetical protein